MTRATNNPATHKRRVRRLKHQILGLQFPV